MSTASAHSLAPQLKPEEDVIFFTGERPTPRRALLVIGGFFALCGLWSLRTMPLVSTGLLLLGGILATWGMVVRHRSCEINLKGIIIRDGRDQWGDVHFTPWRSIQRFGGRPARGGLVRLYFQQAGMPGRDLLPGGTMTVEAFQSLAERLQVALSAQGNLPRLEGA